jgi:hypothetical protein
LTTVSLVLQHPGMIKIEKNIKPDPPLPRRMKYPWEALAVGDSFLMDVPLKVAKTNARQASERYGKTFDAQMHKGRVRVWRWK